MAQALEEVRKQREELQQQVGSPLSQVAPACLPICPGRGGRRSQEGQQLRDSFDVPRKVGESVIKKPPPRRKAL